MSEIIQNIKLRARILELEELLKAEQDAYHRACERELALAIEANDLRVRVEGLLLEIEGR